ncbi:MAG: ankyrin repeat domain-containing protein, partial [Candidatus Nitrotoga sp.]
VAAVVFAAYSVVLSSNFGVMDDYSFLYNAIVRSNDTFTLLIGAGRPLNAVLLDLGFRSTGSIENLTILRAITLVGIWLLGCGIYFFSRVHCVSFISSLAIACGIVLLPSFQVYASWAQHFTTPFAGSIALLSAFILTPACRIRERSKILAILLSTLLLLTSIIIYQPIAMLFCVGIFISIISKPEFSSAWQPSRVIDAITVFVTAMFFGLLIFKIGQYIYPSGSSRYGLVQNIHEKLSWFISEPIANALSMFSVPAKAFPLFAVFLTVLLGTFLLIRRRGSKTVLIIFIYGVFCTLGSYAPNLATAENWASYRSIGALGALIVALLVLMVSEISNFFKRKYATNSLLGRLNKYHWIAPAVLLIILTTRAQSNVLNGFVLPNVTELNNLASTLDDAKGRGSGKFTVIIKPSSWSDSAAKPMAYDEFGMPSSIRDYYAKAIVEIVLRSTNLIKNATVISSVEAIAGKQVDHGTNLVVDFPRLITSQRFKTDPLALQDSSQNGAKTFLRHPPESLPEKNIAVSADSLGVYSSKGDLKTVKLLLNAGIEVNTKNSRGSNALIEASWAGKQEVVSYLLDAKADVNSASSGQLTALSAAVNQKHESVALLLLEHGANPNAVDSVGSTPLIEAAWQGNLALMKTLLAKGATPNYKRPDNGFTALKAAVATNKTDAVQALKAAGATE